MGLFKPDINKMEANKNCKGLIKALHSRDGIIQTLAAHALGRLGDPAAVGPLIELLKNKSPSAAAQAAYALGEIRNIKAVEPLIRALKYEDKTVINEVANALAKIRNEEAIGKIRNVNVVESLNQALKDEDPWTRKAVVRALGKIKDTKAVDVLIQALEDEDDSVRNTALDAIRNAGSVAVEGLIWYLKDERKAAQLEASIILGDIGDARATESLLHILKHQNSKVRLAAVRALGKIGSRTAIEPFIRTLETDEDAGVKNEVAEALGKIGDIRAVEPIALAYFQHSIAPIVAHEALLSLLKRLGQPAALPMFKGLRYREQSVRQFALDLLREVGLQPKSITDKVYYLVESGEMDALSKLSEPGLTEALADVIKSRTPSGTLLRALVHVAGANAVETLVWVLERSDSKAMRVESARLLGNIGDSRAVEPLIQALTYQSAELRAKAVLALGGMRVDDARDLNPLAQALLDNHGDIALEAERIILKIKNRKRIIDSIKRVLLKDEKVYGSRIPIMLNTLGWLPENDVERAYFMLMSQFPNLTNEQVVQLGPIAVEPLIKIFKYALIHFDNIHINSVNKEAVKAASCLGKIGDLRAAKPVIRGLFQKPTAFCHYYELPSNLYGDLSNLFCNYTKLILGASLGLVGSPQGDVDRWKIGLADSTYDAVDYLCGINTSISSNILHEVLRRNNLIEVDCGAEEFVPGAGYFTPHYYQVEGLVTFGDGPWKYMRKTQGDYIDVEHFLGERLSAEDELQKRGNPPFDSSVYLIREAWKI